MPPRTETKMTRATKMSAATRPREDTEDGEDEEETVTDEVVDNDERPAMARAPPTAPAPLPRVDDNMVSPVVDTRVVLMNTTASLAPPPPLSTSLHIPPMRSDPNTVSLPVVLPSVPVVASSATVTRGVPINVPTRGYVPDVQQVGILTNTENDQILPLYGRPTYPGSSKWLYHAATDKFQSIRVPVHVSSRDCSAEYGCNELSDADHVQIPAYGNREFTVSIYSLDAPRYIPYI